MKSCICLLILIFTFSALAAEVKIHPLTIVKHDLFDLGIGSKVELEFVGQNQKMEAIFVGRMVGSEEFGEELLFLDEKETKIHMVDAESTKSKIAKSRMQTLLSTFDQAGETCMAYALFHFWQQLPTAGYKGNQELQTMMISERSRMKFLEESITRYYMGTSFGLKSIMKDYGSRFGFKCRELVFDDSKKAIEYVYNRALQAKPVLMEFFLGPNMVESSYEIEDWETKIKLDPLLWIPRKVGERNSSGHALVAAGAFMAKGRKKIMVLDSNWTEPRVWDLERYLGGKTAIDEMIFHSCD